MKSKMTVLLVAGLLAGPLTANATSVSWTLQGTFDSDPTGSDVVASGLNLKQGDTFSVVVTFDTSTPVTNPGVCGDGSAGKTCRFNGAPATNQYFSSLIVNGTLIPQFRSPGPQDTFYFNTLIARNDAQVGGAGPAVDGYSWGSELGCNLFGGAPLPACTVGRDHDFLNVVFRGPVLDLVTNARQLPTSPPAGLASLDSRSFQLCSGQVVERRNDLGQVVGLDNDCRYALLLGTFNAVSSVPEPGTLALLGLGLVGLGATRRRKAA